MPTSADLYDVIIVGAGSTGCILASRLSENPDRRVLLIDAGPHYPDVASMPPEIAWANNSSAWVPGHPNNWGFVGELFPGRGFPTARGKVMGGSSSLNGTYFIRGKPEDFDAWSASGNDAWSYERVLPAFCRIETDHDFSDSYHGSAGPIPIHRPRPDQLQPVSRAFIGACRAAGFSADLDKNAPTGEGVGPIPRNCERGIRMSTALTHLKPALHRPNLTVCADTLVRRVLFDGLRAVGVEAECGGRQQTFSGGEIVLCAGAIKSPHLLLLSGIGRASDLRKYDIETLVDNPNVGRHLKDHAVIPVHFRIRGNQSPLPHDFMPIETCLNYTSPGSTLSGDSQISCMAASMSRLLSPPGKNGSLFMRALQRPIATLKALRGVSARVLLNQLMTNELLSLNCMLTLPQSTGAIELASPDPATGPAIHYNYLSERDDVLRMRDMVRTCANLLATAAFREHDAQPTSIDRHCLDDDTALDGWIRENLGSAYHSCGTLRMGSASDTQSVVDQFGRVHGIDALRVLDLSIVPGIMSRGTSATAAMIGERASEFFN